MMTLHAKAERIGSDIAAKYAAEVDREGRFPRETFDELKSARLLGAMVPRELGGEGATFTEICDICCVLGQYCASTAMIYAMHQIQVVCLLDCAIESAWHRQFLARVAEQQLLLASSTSEAGIGGDFRNSVCAIERNGAKFHLRKEAIVISYGNEADCILVTARRNAEAPSSDQVMAVIERSQYTLQRTTTPWDTLGMRGVCSDGHILEVYAPCEQIAPEPFAEIAAQSMLGSSHLLWASMWYGLSSAAIARAQSFVKADARRKNSIPAGPTPAGLRLAHMVSQIQAMKSRLADGIRLFEQARKMPDGLTSLSFTVAMNSIKISGSETMIAIINDAMMICGIYGYKNDTPYSLGRLLRDASSAPIMINNDRILGNTSNLLMMHRPETTLLGL